MQPRLDPRRRLIDPYPEDAFGGLYFVPGHHRTTKALASVASRK